MHGAGIRNADAEAYAYAGAQVEKPCQEKRLHVSEESLRGWRGQAGRHCRRNQENARAPNVAEGERADHQGTVG